MSKKELPSLEDFILENSKQSVVGAEVARFWGKGRQFTLGPEGEKVREEIKQKIVEWTQNWSDPKKCVVIKEQLNQLKSQAAKDFEGLNIPESINREDLKSGYLFAIYSRNQTLDEVVKLQTHTTPRYEEHMESNKQIVKFLQGGEFALKKNAIHMAIEPIVAHIGKLSAGGKESKAKSEAIKVLKENIDKAKGDLPTIQKLVNEALKSEYRHLHQTNKILVNRGPFHMHWIHSLVHKKRNPEAAGRLSRSKTEDLLIDLKKSVDDAVKFKEDQTKVQGQEPSSSVDLSSSNQSG